MVYFSRWFHYKKNEWDYLGGFDDLESIWYRGNEIENIVYTHICGIQKTSIVDLLTKQNRHRYKEQNASITRRERSDGRNDDIHY